MTITITYVIEKYEVWTALTRLSSFSFIISEKKNNTNIVITQRDEKMQAKKSTPGFIHFGLWMKYFDSSTPFNLIEGLISSSSM